MFSRIATIRLTLVLSIAIAANMSRAATALDYLNHFDRSASYDHFTVDDARPLREAARILTYEYGVRVSYEEAALEYQGDLVDITEQIRRPTGPQSSVRVFAPRSGQPLTASVSKESGTGKPANAMGAATETLAGYDSNSGTTRFALQGTKTYIHIVPFEIRDVTGKWKQVTPVMSQGVSLAGGEMTFRAAVDAVVKQLHTERDPVKSLIWAMGDQTLSVPTVNNQPARQVLSDLIESLTNSRMNWMLSHDPTLRSYYLVIETADKPAAPPAINRDDLKHVQPLPQRDPTAPSPSGRRIDGSRQGTPK